MDRLMARLIVAQRIAAERGDRVSYYSLARRIKALRVEAQYQWLANLPFAMAAALVATR